MKIYYKLLLKRLIFPPFYLVVTNKYWLPPPFYLVVTNKYWLPLNKRKVVFDNFGGRGYGDNPKYIADELLKQDENLDLVWVVENMSTFVPKGVRKVWYGSWGAFFEWSTAKVWIDNIITEKLKY
ncbi:TPA: CDP-glycerol glycerophosphotransferase family protein [Streptococcus pneumoniae]